MRPDPKTLLRGAIKIVAVALAAGLAGAGIGIGLAELTGGEEASIPVATPTSGTAERTSTATASRSPTQTQTVATAPTGGPQLVPSVRVLSAQIGPISDVTGNARVTAQVRVQNRDDQPLALVTPVLVSDADEVPLDPDAKTPARPLLEPLAPGESATGVLRFTVAQELARRLQAAPLAQLRIAGRRVRLALGEGTTAAVPAVPEGGSTTTTPGP